MRRPPPPRMPARIPVPARSCPAPKLSRVRQRTLPVGSFHRSVPIGVVLLICAHRWAGSLQRGQEWPTRVCRITPGYARFAGAAPHIIKSGRPCGHRGCTRQRDL
eukprot:CAMPEP_0115517676 /NCGR_PEP_ID=MMETSP0271-20121206/77445_1 /TAXON_ID=71861 /ORGANISM="Scrippsiella trochoidea, Strain CCMP3099" /LENGTH=104 /DNA_ID=CAMNT_0002948467 /DNA_START=487 /DNA_END=801 /DNA_ORIENTATION=-